MHPLLQRSLCCALLSTLASCMLMDVPEQQARLDALCRIEGHVTASAGEAKPIIVLLAAERADTARAELVDHFVLDQPGRWVFVTTRGTYRVGAFQDTNDDLRYQPGEPFSGKQLGALRCEAGTRIADIDIALSKSSNESLANELDVAALKARSLENQERKTLGQLTASGELASPTDPRFDLAKASNGLWRPFDYMLESNPGIYFVEPYDKRKIPVLFVHGINGSPANFSYLIEHLDRSRYQAWMYNYPSGAHLSTIAEHLNQTMQQLELRYQVERYAVVAHSMGGLVSRGFILRHAKNSTPGQIPLFITMSSPWAGHAAAAMGVKYAPTAVRVWNDMAPNSEYLQSLFAAKLPANMKHHLVFTFKGESADEANDGSVTVASQLDSHAQTEAQRLYGFADTHTGILSNARAASLMNELLAAQFSQ